MSDYNWKSCSNPANAARLRELLAAKRNIIGRFDGGTIGYLDVEIIPEVFIFRKVFFLDPDEPAQMRAHTCECVCGCTEPTNDELCADCHVRNIRGNECQTWQARIAELEAENQRLTEIARYENEHLANYRKQLKDRDEREGKQ